MRPQKPIDAAGLQAMALHYAARFATTSTKLRQYLQRKLRERPWVGEGTPDLDALVARLVTLGYVDDVGWAVMKRRAMQARGLGPMRVAQALLAAGVGDAEAEAEATAENVAENVAENPILAAVRFARRRRLGPFRRDGAAMDAVSERRAVAAMLRAGHSLDVTRRVLAARDAEAADALAEDDD